MPEKEKSKRTREKIERLLFGNKEEIEQLQEFQRQITPWLEEKFKNFGTDFSQIILDIDNNLLKTASLNNELLLIATPFLISLLIITISLVLCISNREIAKEIFESGLFGIELGSIIISNILLQIFHVWAENKERALKKERKIILKRMMQQGMQNAYSDLPNRKTLDFFKFIIQVQQRLADVELIKQELFILEDEDVNEVAAPTIVDSKHRLIGR